MVLSPDFKKLERRNNSYYFHHYGEPIGQKQITEPKCLHFLLRYDVAMSKDTSNRLLIELHVPDFNQVLDFYGKLGFKKVWHRSEHTNADYLVMEREGVVLCFWPGNDKVHDQSYFKQFPKNTKRGYGVELVITVDDIDAYYEKVRGFAKVVSKIVNRPWGLRDFRIEDPFGYYLRVTERHDITDPNYAVPAGVIDND